MSKCVLLVQLKIPQMPHNLFRPSAQISQLFGKFKKKPRHMSIVHVSNSQV